MPYIEDAQPLSSPHQLALVLHVDCPSSLLHSIHFTVLDTSEFSEVSEKLTINHQRDRSISVESHKEILE